MDLTEKRFKLTPKRIEACHRLGLFTTDDLLGYYPFRYETLQSGNFSDWKIKEKVTFEGVIVQPASSYRHGKMVITRFSVMAYDRVFKVTIFNRPWAKGLNVEQTVTIQGVYMGQDKITATSYDTKALSEHKAVTPVYGVKNGIKQSTVSACVERIYTSVENEICDTIPEKYIFGYRLLRKASALRRIHFPESMQEVKDAYRTLKYEEFLKFFLAMEMMKNENSTGVYKEPVLYDRTKVNQIIRSLSFSLTTDQIFALEDCLKDMGSDRTMYRLVQGDVGCGKTAVASLCLYACVTGGKQGAFLAPTEILARQHLESLEELLNGTNVRMEVLYSGMNNVEKERIKKETEEGKIDILIGTHSLLQEDVVFRNLGLVVVDEQQRFGVEQRRTMRRKGESTDFLLMTATPIPRTLASTMFGDMEISTIETMPAGRKTPVTKFIEENSFRTVLKDVTNLLHEGRQLYVICAAVEENPDFEVRNVQDVGKTLSKLFPKYRVGILHGRMNSQQKQDMMKEFAENHVQILVSTTVVEVGMNVINATGMIIYDADRFGLSQLHQLRGRIKRGKDVGYCWLLSGSQDPKVKERLNVLVHSDNGFEISYEDLRLRGPGDILGTRQSGVPDLILGNPITDTAIINTARKDAKHIIENPDDPDFACVIEYARNRCASYTD